MAGVSVHELDREMPNEEEPDECIECGKHSMFASEAASRMIRMCDDCRIASQYHSENNPFAGGDRPRVRVSDDYFSKRRDH